MVTESEGVTTLFGKINEVLGSYLGEMKRFLSISSFEPNMTSKFLLRLRH